MKAIILIHGFLTNKDDFYPLYGLLEDLYDKVIYYEAPGHTIEPDYSLFNYDDTFKTLLDTYDSIKDDYDQIDLIGFSMGGALATYLQQVRKIDNLVLLAPANKYLNIKLIGERVKFIIKSKKNLNKAKNENEDLYELCKHNLDSLKKDDKLSFEMAFKDLFPNWTIHNLSTFTKIINKCNKELLCITPRTLIIWGKLDQLVPFESIKFLKELLIYKNKIVIYDDISHLMLKSNQKHKIVLEILDFLKGE